MSSTAETSGEKIDAHKEEEGVKLAPLAPSTSTINESDGTGNTTPVEPEIPVETARNPTGKTEGSSHAEPINASEVPPNGGWLAWMQVAGSFFLFFNSWGTVNSFGVFQTYYEINPLWKADPSDIAWIGSVQAFLLLLVGVLSGRLFDAGYFRTLVMTGTFLVPFGFMMTSLCTDYWQTMLAQGIVVGIGSGCLFVPSVTILPQYFSSRKAFANGVAASGSSLAGIIYPILFRRLQLRIGFPWATRVLAFMAFGTLLFACFVMKQRLTPHSKRPLTQLSAFKEPPYSLFTMGMLFSFMGFYAPVYYLQNYAIEERITDENLGFYLLPILNAASIPGRIVPNIISDYVGPLNVMTIASSLTAILALAWIAVHNLGGILAFAIIYGFCSGAFISLPAVAVVSLTSDLRVLGTRMGQVFFVSAFGLLIGSPVAGAIYTATGKYLGLQLFSGLSLMVTVMLLTAARVYLVGWSPSARA